MNQALTEPAKPLPPTTGGVLTRLRRGRTRLFATTEWEQFQPADWPQHIMQQVLTDRLHEKQGRSIVRWTVTKPNGDKHVVYLKRHYKHPRWKGWLAALSGMQGYSDGWREFLNLKHAKELGLPLPSVSAAGELMFPLGNLQSFIAVEELHGQIGLHEAVPLAFRTLPPQHFARWKRGLFMELARLSREIHRRRYFHKDLYFCHFYIAETDTANVPDTWQGRVVMIDFHRFARHRIGWQWFLVKDLAQLLYSSDVPGVTARDRLRFWKHYTAGDWGSVSPPSRWLRNMVQRKFKLYARHNAKRKAKEAPKAAVAA